MHKDRYNSTQGYQSDTLSQAQTTSHSNSFFNNKQLPDQKGPLKANSRPIVKLNPESKRKMSDFLNRF